VSYQLDHKLSLVSNSTADQKLHDTFDVRNSYEKDSAFIEDEADDPVDVDKTKQKLTKEMIQSFINNKNKLNATSSATT
jgi:vacuolar-type H+-ATPase catalytic subunit A/Vma1